MVTGSSLSSPAFCRSCNSVLFNHAFSFLPRVNRDPKYPRGPLPCEFVGRLTFRPIKQRGFFLRKTWCGRYPAHATQHFCDVLDSFHRICRKFVCTSRYKEFALLDIHYLSTLFKPAPITPREVVTHRCSASTARWPHLHRPPDSRRFCFEPPHS